MRDVEQLIRSVEAAGSRLWTRGEILRIEPAPPASLLHELKAERDQVYDFVKRCGRSPGERVGGVDDRKLFAQQPVSVGRAADG